MTILDNHINGLIKELSLVAKYLRRKGYYMRAYRVEQRIKSFDKYGRKYMPLPAARDQMLKEIDTHRVLHVSELSDEEIKAIEESTVPDGIHHAEEIE